MTERGHLVALLGVLWYPTVTRSLTCVVGPLFSNTALGDFVSVRLALASRAKGRVVKRVCGDFAVMEVRSVYGGSHLEEMRVGGVRLLHFAGGMLASSVRAGAADMLPGFVFFPVAVDALTKACSKRSHCEADTLQVSLRHVGVLGVRTMKTQTLLGLLARP